LTKTADLAEQLLLLHSQLPQLQFAPEEDSTADQIPAARPYLAHYGLHTLTLQPGIRHFLGAIKCRDYTIACQYWLPPTPTGTVFVVHGYFDHTGLYGHLIQYLIHKNLVVVAFDLPGHGLSDGEQVSIGSFDHYVEVFEEILKHANTHLPRPWHCVGQSTGGAIALKHLLDESDNKHLFTNIALLAPLLHPRLWRSNRLVYLVANLFLSRIKRSFKNNSSDKAFVTFLDSQDPMQARHIPLAWIGAMKRWIEEFHDSPRSSYSLAIIQGDCDETLDWQYNLRQFKDKLPQADIHVIRGAQHHLSNETEQLRNQIFAAMGF
jgi:lysophospholipase